jgi:hypothetical protein
MVLRIAVLFFSLKGQFHEMVVEMSTWSSSLGLNASLFSTLSKKIMFACECFLEKSYTGVNSTLCFSFFFHEINDGKLEFSSWRGEGARGRRGNLLRYLSVPVLSKKKNETTKKGNKIKNKHPESYRGKKSGQTCLILAWSSRRSSGILTPA